jgi:hypothetical protein
MRNRTRGMKGRVGWCLQWFAFILLGLGLVILPTAGQDRPEGQDQPRPAVAYSGLPSENTALTLSVIGTLAGVTCFLTDVSWFSLGGIALGPSLGFMYGDCWGRGLMTAVLRFGGTFAVLLAALENDESDLSVLAWGWIGGMTALAVLDVATVKKAVHRRNEVRMARRKLNVAMAPFVLPKGAGVQLRLSF